MEAIERRSADLIDEASRTKDIGTKPTWDLNFTKNIYFNQC